MRSTGRPSSAGTAGSTSRLSPSTKTFHGSPTPVRVETHARCCRGRAQAPPTLGQVRARVLVTAGLVACVLAGAGPALAGDPGGRPDDTAGRTHRPQQPSG